MSEAVILAIFVLFFGGLMVLPVLRVYLLPNGTWLMSVGGSSIRVVERWFRVDVYVDGRLCGTAPINVEGTTQVLCDGLDVVLVRKSGSYGPDPTAHIHVAGQRLLAAGEVDGLRQLPDSAVVDVHRCPHCTGGALHRPQTRTVWF